MVDGGGFDSANAFDEGTLPGALVFNDNNFEKR